MQGPSGIESLLFIFEITPQADFYPNIINIDISLDLQNNVIFFLYLLFPSVSREEQWSVATEMKAVDYQPER